MRMTNSSLTNVFYGNRDEIPKNFVVLLQHIFKMTGYTYLESDPNCTLFANFTCLSLLQVSSHLCQVKDDLSLTLTNEEIEAQEQLRNFERFHPDSKMLAALKIFCSEFPNFLERIVLEAKFCDEVQRESDSFHVCLLSDVFITLSKRFLSQESSLSITKKRKFIDSVSEENDLNHVPANLNLEANICEFEKSSFFGNVEFLTQTKKYEIYKISANRNYLLKVLKSEFSTSENITSLRNEYETSKMVFHPAFRSSLERVHYHGKHALILEWAHGCCIDEIKNQLNIKDFLNIAREIVSAVVAIHRKSKIHLNISCKHILCNEKLDTVKLISHGSSEFFQSNVKVLSKQFLRENDLRCISPEQTGMVRANIDCRSDFYSLGVVFYRLLANKYPFDSEYNKDVIQKHFLDDPVPVHEVNTSVPKPLSNLISKLLQKNSDDRYHSATGIIFDIDSMIEEYPHDNELKFIELAQNDNPMTFLLPNKLYGRAEEFEEISAALARVNKNNSEIVFLSGMSGSGKSSLMQELFKPISRRGGFICIGKFDSCRKEPLSAFVEALMYFCESLRFQDEDMLSKFKSEIQNALGGEGAIVTDLLSNLNFIIGSQKPSAELVGKEAKNRLNYLLLSFFKAICSVGPPIALILDDVHWIDDLSSNFLCLLLSDKLIKNIMIVVSYRNCDISKDHPLTILHNLSNRLSLDPVVIELKNLNEHDVISLITDAFGSKTPESYLLTTSIYDKTKGNPLLLRETLFTFFAEGMITFNDETSTWNWDSSVIEEMDKNEDVLDLLRRKFLQLNNQTQLVLKVASCLGSPFLLKNLKRIINHNESIHDAISRGILIQDKADANMYRFVHDSYQNAATSMLPPNREELFLYIGKRLCVLLSDEERYESIFVISNLLLKAVHIVSDEEDRSKLSSLFLQAGRKALTSTAFSSASKYLDVAIKLLNFDAWQSRYEFCLELYNVAVNAAFCTGNENLLVLIKTELLSNVSSLLELASSTHMHIRLLNDKQKYAEAINVGVSFLCTIGVDVKLDQSESDLYEEINNAKNLFMKRNNDEILSMKKMENRKEMAVMLILYSINTSCFFVNYNLFASIVTRMAVITFNHGINKFSSVGFSLLGFTLSINNDVACLRFADLGLRLLKFSNDRELLPMVYLPCYTMIVINYKPIQHTILPLKHAHQVSLEMGNVVVSVLSANQLCAHQLFSGDPIDNVRDHIEYFQDRLAFQTPTFKVIHQLVINLQEDVEYPHELTGREFDYRSCLYESKDPRDKAICLTCCAFLSYLFDDFSSASKLLDLCKPYESYLFTNIFSPIRILYEGLVLIKKLSKLESTYDSIERIELQEKVKNCIAQLSDLAKQAPANFSNKYHLLLAEYHGYHNNEAEAMAEFDKSITLAQKHGLLHEAAIATERAGLLLIQMNSLKASSYIERCQEIYLKWGAITKAKHLTTKYSAIFDKKTNDRMLFALDSSVCSQGSISQLTLGSSLK